MIDSPGDDTGTLALTTIHDRVARQLATAQQRYTSGRRRLVTLLVAAGRPLSLPELLDLDPGLPQSSAYRNLDILESTGLVRRIATETDHARYELAESLLGHHHHLICTACGSIQDVRLPPDVEDAVEVALAAAASAAGFRPERHTLDLHGTCAACRPGHPDPST
jgi:Fe2+ or Zn2+ uptake regulation protein